MNSRRQSGERKSLDRALSRAGLCSRAQAAEWIRAGRVRVNGSRAVDPEARVDLARERVTVDGKLVRATRRIVIALNKPVGYVTTRSDPEGRKTVYQLLGDRAEWIAPVGRLDRDTSGLLLFTNDTELAASITDPESKLPKCYRVEARGTLADEALDRLRLGIELEDGPTLPARVGAVQHVGGRTHFELTIFEGRNRQVRRMLEAVGSRVLALQRIAIGSVRLGALALGEWRELDERELARLRPGGKRA